MSSSACRGHGSLVLRLEVDLAPSDRGGRARVLEVAWDAAPQPLRDLRAAKTRA